MKVFDKNGVNRHKDVIGETKVQLVREMFKKSSSNVTEYPKEKRKCLIAFLMYNFSAAFLLVSMTMTHQKVPDRNLYKPLPDISLDNIAKITWFGEIADILIILSNVTIVVIIALHRHGWILTRRLFFIFSILYFLRGVTIFITVLPMSNDHYYCWPKIDTFSYSPMAIVKETLKAIHAMWLSGENPLCGDYIFSGHTITYTLSNLLVREYVPKRCSIIQWLSWITFLSGMISLLVSHGHYSIDVLISYYITSRLFWIYHALANNPELKEKLSNSSSALWWFPIFLYLEANVTGELPKEFSISFSRFRRKVISVLSILLRRLPATLIR